MTREERKQALDWFRNRSKTVTMPGAKRMYLLAIEALSAQPERKTGRLLDANPYGKCSCCGWLIDSRDGFNYCPNCGADMREEQHE